MCALEVPHCANAIDNAALGEEFDLRIDGWKDGALKKSGLILVVFG